MENQKVFRSRISVFLLVFLLAVFISCTIPLINQMIISGLYIMGGMFVFVVFLFSGMRYIVSGDKLYVRLWTIPMKNVDILKITSVERSYNTLASTAVSLKRLRLCLGNGAKFPFMLISPVRELEFIETLKRINPNINVHIPVKKGSWRVMDLDI